MTRLDRRSPEAAEYRKLYKTRQWRHLRAGILDRAAVCCRCLDRGIVVAATVVNHIRPHRGDLDLFFDRDNLQAVCKPCHDGPIQKAEGRGYSTEIGADGWPTDPLHPTNRGGGSDL